MKVIFDYECQNGLMNLIIRLFILNLKLFQNSKLINDERKRFTASLIFIRLISHFFTNTLVKICFSRSNKKKDAEEEENSDKIPDWMKEAEAAEEAEEDDDIPAWMKVLAISVNTKLHSERFYKFEI